MFFPKKNQNFKYGDHRSVRRFALFPRQLIDETRTVVGIVWLGYYDRVEMFYIHKLWSTAYSVVLDYGQQVATDLATMYGGRYIDEG